MTNSQTLSARQALQIAANYGFSIRDGNWEKSLIRDSIIQARQAAASIRHDGMPYKAADQYFDGYMNATAAEIRGEAGKAAQFERDAYGY